jgi:ABC-2 type transport system ATP-binding protein
MRSVLTSALALVALAALAPAASARDQIVTSFDGTPLSTSFFPAAGLKPGQKAPTVLMTHGWGQMRSRDENGASLEAVGAIGVGPLRKAGFNVLTWDSRGFGESGGTVTVDFKDNEGRDVVSLISWLAGQPEARLDKAGDPRVGMHGASYAGGIEWVAVGDRHAHRRDRPRDLLALAPDRPVPRGHGEVRLGLGALRARGADGDGRGRDLARRRPDREARPAHHLRVHVGARDGPLQRRGPRVVRLPGAERRPRRPRAHPDADAPGHGRHAVHAERGDAQRGDPAAQRRPHKLIWFCGGHGACLTGSGTPGRLEKATVAWLRRYLARDTSVGTGPGFEWLADDAQWRTAAAFPPPAGAPLVAKGAGQLVVNPGDAASGTIIAAAPAANAVNVEIPSPKATTEVVGEPRLALSYKGTGSAASGHVFAQIVDEQRNLALGNEVTPIPVTLDGNARTVTRSLEGGAASIAPGARYRLQVIGGSQVYGPVRDAVSIQFSSIRLTLPTASPSGFSGPGAGSGGVLPTSRRCLSRRRFEIRVRRGHGRKRLRSARVYVDGRRVKVHRRAGRLRAVVDLRGRQKQQVRVRIVARTRSGKRRHDTRVYRTCTPRRKKHR